MTQEGWLPGQRGRPRPAAEPADATAADPDPRLYLGWQYATPVHDPGPPPRRPVPQEQPRLSADWLMAQRREEKLISRPLRVTVTTVAVVAIALAACVAAGLLSLLIAAPAIAACLVAAAMSGYAIWQGERWLRDRIRAERLRIERFRGEQDSRLFASQSEHARQVSQWRARRLAFESAKRWYAVSVPDGIDRVDVAGGTFAGWSALLTMTAAHRLAAGGEVTVIDLSGSGAAADVVGLAAASGAQPAVLVLPRDLPRFDMAASLSPAELADVLALSASVGQERTSAREIAIDTAILVRLLGVLASGGAIRVSRVTAALRALAQVGDPRADIDAGLLTEREASAVGTLFGQGATDRVVLERALGIEAQLRTLAEVGAEPAGMSGPLRVIAIDKRASALSARVVGGFVVTALTCLIDRLPDSAGQTSWRHTLFVLGAEQLRDDVLDRLTDACERTRSGLVLAYRSMPPPVRQRIGRGNAAVAFMRLGNADEAKAASEQIGTEHRFVLAQLTDTIGTSVTDTIGMSYTASAADSTSVAFSSSSSESASRGSGHSRASDRGFARPGGGTSVSDQAGTSRGTSEAVSLTAGISTNTAWGVSTSRAAGDSESLARSLQRSRELAVEPSELQRLPTTAMIISYAAPSGRQVLLADANPAIGALPVATLTPLSAASAPSAWPAGEDFTAGSVSPRPNLGPPPPRLDWRVPPGQRRG